MSFSCLELFSGIGGFAVVAERLGWNVTRAIDISQHAALVYRENFEHDHQVRTIESIPIDELAAVQADLWWMSPPCQPFTRRGVQRDLEDSRCEAFLRIVKAINQIRPAMVAVENVPGFASSSAATALRRVLTDAGYRFHEMELCPTQLGIPNRRRRYYLIGRLSLRERAVPVNEVDRGLCVTDVGGRLRPSATRRPFAERKATMPLRQFLDARGGAGLFVADDLVHQFASALDCLDLDDELAITSCFTSAYGKSPAQAGSYLRVDGRLRRFSPREILRLLGFSDEFRIPDRLSQRQQWKLIGNSLSVPVVEHCLRSALVEDLLEA